MSKLDWLHAFVGDTAGVCDSSIAFTDGIAAALNAAIRAEDPIAEVELLIDELEANKLKFAQAIAKE